MSIREGREWTALSDSPYTPRDDGERSEALVFRPVPAEIPEVAVADVDGDVLPCV